MTCGDLFNCHKSTVGRKIPKVLGKISLLCRMNNIIKMPTTKQELFDTKLIFYKIANFPGVVGAIDCTHVKIQSPGGDIGEVYRKRKGYFSINVQCCCNSYLKICDIEARWPGSVHDQTILENSFLMVRLCRNDFGESVLLGNGGYVNKNFLLTPSSNHKHQQRLTIKNRISQIEALSLGFRVKVETIFTSIVAAAVLHSLAIEFQDDFQEFPIIDKSLINIPPISQDNSNSYRRSALIESHFSTFS